MCLFLGTYLDNLVDVVDQLLILQGFVYFEKL